MKINYYENLHNPQVLGEMDINDYFNRIKNGHMLAQITEARKHGKGTKAYKELKHNRECVSLNFTFKSKKLNENIIDSSGIMMFDIDPETLNSEFDITSIDSKKIFFYHKSFGGNGYTVATRTSGVTFENFKDTYIHIANELGIEKLYDKQARKATQYTILSSDPEIYVNPSPIIFDAVETEYLNPKNPIVLPNTYIGMGSNGSLRFDNTQDYIINGEEYVSDFETGFPLIKCSGVFNRKVEQGYRHHFILVNTTNLIYLNPHVSEDSIGKVIGYLNQQSMNPPLPSAEVNKIIKKLFKSKILSKLKPVYGKPRKIIYNEKLKWDKKKKHEMTNKVLSEMYREQSTKKLFGFIEVWDFNLLGKITQRSIYKNHPISKKTVEKYWSEFKDLVKSLNADNGY